MAAAEKLDKSLEEAAKSLGASPYRIIMDIIIPALKGINHARTTKHY